MTSDLHKKMTEEDIRKIMEEAINRYKESKDVKCLWGGVKPGTPMCMSCPCPKCSAYS